MPRIAILSDLHGNVPATEAVLDDLASQQVDEILVGGDLVGRGPEGSKVVRRVRELGWRCVRGNHEDYLLGFRRREVPEAWLNIDEWAASRWMAAELDDADVDYIAELPLTLASRLAPGLRLVHGTPASNNQGLGPWCSDEEIDRHARAVVEPLLVCGHTHRPMRRDVRGGTVVNVGAVGLPFNRDQRAQYAIFEPQDGHWITEFRQVPYDVDRVLEIYRRTGFLAHGGVTARLLQLELCHAAPFLVPFTLWARATDRPMETSQIEAFLDVYDPDESVSHFLLRLEG